MSGPSSPSLAPLVSSVTALALASLAVEVFAPRLQDRLRRVSVVVLALASLFLVVRAAAFLVLSRPQVQGTDFFYFLCVARDTLDGVPVTELSYAYFPFSYAFWRLALRIGHQDLAVAQWMYVFVLAGNAAALGVAVRRAASSLALGALAAAAYVGAMSRLEGGFGIAEPVGTLPIGVAVAIWAGEPLRGRHGRVLAAVLGAGIGLSALVKQQCALQAAGWVSLVVLQPFTEKEKRHELPALLLVPGTAAVVFFLGTLSEGHGFMPLRTGLSAVAGYEAQSSFGGNLKNAFGRVVPLVVASGLSAALLPLSLRAQRKGAERAFALAAFALAAGTATLLQFTKRGYAHYALNTAPWLVLFSLLGLFLARSRLPPPFRASPTLSFAFLAFAAVSFVQPDLRDRRAFFLWPSPLALTAPDLGHPWLAREMAADIRNAQKYVRRGADVLVLPPRHNEIHFLLGTRSLSFAEHYAWGGVHTKNAPRALTSKTLSAVVVVKPRGGGDQQSWRDQDCDETVAALEKNGFRRAAAMKTLSVWTRKP